MTPIGTRASIRGFTKNRQRLMVVTPFDERLTVFLCTAYGAPE
jgi:hypothetical protein